MSDKARAPKKRKLAAVEGDKNELEAAGPSNRQQPSPPPSDPKIFKLTADCCDEIFEYLTLEDLHSFGQTCKTFNKVAGEYFKRNYSAKRFDVNKQGVYSTYPNYISLSGFNKYVTKLACGTNKIEYLERHTDEFTSIKHLMCTKDILKRPKIIPKIIKKILPKIEILNFWDRHNTDTSNFRSNLSKICPNLKLLSVSGGSKWLHQVYPNLTQINCYPMPPMDDLNIFFERNPGVRRFSAGAGDIWKNRDSLLSSTIKLDLLIVNNITGQFSKSYEFLNDLYERGFYKRLQLDIGHIDQQLCDKLPRLHGLENMGVYGNNKWHNLPQLALNEFHFRQSSTYPNMNELELLSNALRNLEKISLPVQSSDVLLPLFRQSMNLKKIRVLGSRDKALNLSMLNKVREKLAGASKVTIYVHDDDYLATKWTTKDGDTNLEFVEMRRADSF